MQTIAVGRHRIGVGQRVFVIVEAGVNHDGDVERALELIDAAAHAGADAVKFQMFRANDLVTSAAKTAAYQKSATGETSQRAMLSRLELSDDAFERITQRCEQRSILFLATPFGLDEVDRLVALGVPAIKIASTDLTNHSLLERAAGTQLPLILSTGASTEEEIGEAVGLLRKRRAANRLVLLHCVSRYPTPLDAINLGAIQSLREAHSLPCGLSDHTTSTYVGAWATAAGACVLEKHFTLDQAAPGPDHAMSLSPKQLKHYIAAVRQVELAMGDGRLGLAQEESPVRAIASRSVVSKVEIASGTAITADMLTLKRPGTGIPAAAIDGLFGRRSCVDIPSDTTLSWDMVR